MQLYVFTNQVAIYILVWPDSIYVFSNWQESLITWCNDNPLDLQINKTKKLELNSNVSNMNAAAKKLQNSKIRMAHTHL